MGASVAAQENATAAEPNPNATVESDTLGGDLAAADTLEHTETIRFSDATRIIGWEFADDRVQVAIATNISATVTVSDALAGVGEPGAVQVPKTTRDLERGVHVITFPVETVRGGSAVGVNVDGATVRLSTALDDQQEANPFETFGGESGLFTGVIMTVILATLGAWWVLRSEERGVIEAWSSTVRTVDRAVRSSRTRWSALAISRYSDGMGVAITAGPSKQRSRSTRYFSERRGAQIRSCGRSAPCSRNSASNETRVASTA